MEDTNAGLLPRRQPGRNPARLMVPGGLVLALAVVGSFGCSGALRMSPCPAEGGPAWQHLQSPHFSLSTDLTAAEARVAIHELEALRAAILTVAWPELNPEQSVRLEVVALRDLAEFASLFGATVRGLMVPGDWPLIALSGTPREWKYGTDRAGHGRPSILAHELVHHISWLFRLRQPPWLSEGLASFFETVKLSEDCLLYTSPSPRDS